MPADIEYPDRDHMTFEGFDGVGQTLGKMHSPGPDPNQNHVAGTTVGFEDLVGNPVNDPT